MRVILQVLSLCLILGFGAPAGAQTGPEPDIEQVIKGQITAFKADDFDAAFAYASPFIKRMFGSADSFGQMVQRGYPMVHRPSDVRFLGLRAENGMMLQRVLLRDAAGRAHLLDYAMIQTENGWQINGVSLVQDTGVSA